MNQTVLLRVSTLSVAGLLAVLMLTSVLPPIVADQTDRAVIDAPLILLTAPIEGEVDSISATPGQRVDADDIIAKISNPRLDRSTFISLQEKDAGAQQELEATRRNEQTDRDYLTSLDDEIARQTEQQRLQLAAEITGLRAKLAQSQAVSGASKAVVDRETELVKTNTASPVMVRPAAQQFSASIHQTEADQAKLNEKIIQAGALDKGIYVGEDLVALDQLTQKRRDIALDEARMAAKEKELAGLLDQQRKLAQTEAGRLEVLANAAVSPPISGAILSVGTTAGRHVNPGDTLASLVDCDSRIVVAIFSYRQAQDLAVGSAVAISGASFKTGTVTALLPKISDQADDRYAVPFPQTERRELYAIIAPQVSDTAEQDRDSSSCEVGKWVTVTRSNGVVPSMSVAWRKLGTLVSSVLPRAAVQPVAAKARSDGLRRLSERFRDSPAEAHNWLAQEGVIPQLSHPTADARP